jgi:hypothetical protein
MEFLNKRNSKKKIKNNNNNNYNNNNKIPLRERCARCGSTLLRPLLTGRVPRSAGYRP